MSDVITADVLRKCIANAEALGLRDPKGYVLMAAPGSVTDEALALAPSLGVTIMDHSVLAPMGSVNEAADPFPDWLQGEAF